MVISLEAITKESTVYYYKFEKGKYISLIDTPGLSDTMKLKNLEIDNIYIWNKSKKLFLDITYA